jgi:hypothetical protein
MPKNQPRRMLIDVFDRFVQLGQGVAAVDGEGLELLRALMHDDFGIRYTNCGDWVESCTVLVEHKDGRFEIINWPNHESASRPLTDADVIPVNNDAEVAA